MLPPLPANRVVAPQQWNGIMSGRDSSYPPLLGGPIMSAHDEQLTRRVSVDPKVCSGKPVIRGTRIMVTNVLSMLAAGYTVERVREAYPELTREDIAAALDYASAIIDEEKVYPRG
jgi:uncharacterized protein (DUF433 family)